MQATDFIFDGVALSSFGFIIGSLDSSSGVVNVDAGVPLGFRTVSRRKGQKWSLVDTRYDDALEVTFDIFKNPCANNENIATITDAEFLQISKWLRRRQFKTLKFLDETLSVPRYYRVLFNITKLVSDDALIGLRLVATTDKPYAYGEPITERHTFAAGGSWVLADASYVYGVITPSLTIKCLAAGDLTMSNVSVGSTMQIKNCLNNETITIDGENLIITSSSTEHAIWNDFNYEFLKIGTIPEGSNNTITASLACEVAVSYSPIIHDAP